MTVNWIRRSLNFFTANNTWFGTQAQETTANGAKVTQGYVTELKTLSTIGTTSDTTIDLPANALLEAVVARVTTTISGGGVTSIDIGDPTTAARFITGMALSSGTTGVGLNHMKGAVTTDAAGPTQSSTAKIRITANGGTPSAGVVRLTAFYLQFTPPTS